MLADNKNTSSFNFNKWGHGVCKRTYTQTHAVPEKAAIIQTSFSLSCIFEKLWKITFSQSPNWVLQIASFVQPIIQNPQTLH